MEQPNPVTKSHIILVFVVAMLLLILGVPFIAATGIIVALVVIEFLVQQYVNKRNKKKEETLNK